MSQPDPIVMAKIGAPFGVQGYNHIQSYSDPAESILAYKHFYIKNKNGIKKVDIESGRMHAHKMVMKIAGINDRDAAALLTGSELMVERTALPVLPEGEYYWRDLEGLNVVTREGVVLGQVAYLYTMGAYANMLIKDPVANIDRHIPFIEPDFVQQVDLINKTIVVDWDPTL